jgi:hypothetical protein
MIDAGAGRAQHFRGIADDPWTLDGLGVTVRIGRIGGERVDIHRALSRSGPDRGVRIDFILVAIGCFSADTDAITAKDMAGINFPISSTAKSKLECKL